MRSRLALVAGCVLVALVVAVVVAARTPQASPAVPAGSVRLGPDDGEPVAAYLARARASLPPQGTTALAFVQFGMSRPAAEALAAVPAAPVEAVFRIDLPRVQTALHFEPLEPQVLAATALDSARQRAAGESAAAAAASTGRTRDVAAAEAAVLGRADCACVLALVVPADGAQLARTAAEPGVRAVQATPAGATLRELALSPLLPGQTVRADPLPDDGPVPGA